MEGIKVIASTVNWCQQHGLDKWPIYWMMTQHSVVGVLFNVAVITSWLSVSVSALCVYDTGKVSPLMATSVFLLISHRFRWTLKTVIFNTLPLFLARERCISLSLSLSIAHTHTHTHTHKHTRRYTQGASEGYFLLINNSFQENTCPWTQYSFHSGLRKHEYKELLKRLTDVASPDKMALIIVTSSNVATA